MLSWRRASDLDLTHSGVRLSSYLPIHSIAPCLWPAISLVLTAFCCTAIRDLVHNELYLPTPHLDIIIRSLPAVLHNFQTSSPCIGSCSAAHCLVRKRTNMKTQVARSVSHEFCKLPFREHVVVSIEDLRCVWCHQCFGGCFVRIILRCVCDSCCGWCMPSPWVCFRLGLGFTRTFY